MNKQKFMNELVEEVNFENEENSSSLGERDAK